MRWHASGWQGSTLARLRAKSRLLLPCLPKPTPQVKAASARPVTNALLFLALPGAEGSISFDKRIVLNTEVPHVMSVSVSSGDGVYGTGDELNLKCTFSQSVVVVGEDSGTPSIGLELGRPARDARALYSGGNGTDEFLFSYIVSEARVGR